MGRLYLKYFGPSACIRHASSSSEVVEKLCVIAIQAHAELDTWQQVLPFVLTVYGGIECCPQTIIQLCLLLHARVEDYAQCQALVSVWLRNSNNFSDPEYVDLAQAFIQHIMVQQKQGIVDLSQAFIWHGMVPQKQGIVDLSQAFIWHGMVPQKQVALIPAFLESCPGLSVSQKEDLNAHYADIMKAEVEQATIDRETERKEEQASKSKDIESDFINFLRASGSALFRRFPPLSLHQVSKIAAVLMLLYLIGIKSTKDISGRVRNTPQALLASGAQDMWYSLRLCLLSLFTIWTNG
ncbi:hypothetical protein FSP39_017335 [Pinctada imbricata]|uniref:Peroxisome assembly protein 26 n=1 Tax=Pinctada imbricata TaxID=66713 RepID=A0AA89C265_PINIB|nr:hypothetical protein FSP39_017335 [Pinctada imbricata]